MFENRYREQYSGMTVEQLEAERLKQEKIIEEKTEIWKTTDLVEPIIWVAIGLTFFWLLPLSIPLLVIFIPRIVNKAVLRNQCNQAIYHARDRIGVLDELLEKKRAYKAGKEEAVEVEVVAK